MISRGEWSPTPRLKIKLMVARDVLEPEQVPPVDLDLPEQARRHRKDIWVDGRFPMLGHDLSMIASQALHEDGAVVRVQERGESGVEPF